MVVFDLGDFGVNGVQVLCKRLVEFVGVFVSEELFNFGKLFFFCEVRCEDSYYGIEYRQCRREFFDKFFLVLCYLFI